MTTQMPTTLPFNNAIYEAYMTGKVGTTFALLMFLDGVIAGADSGDGKYDGDYEVTPDKKHIVGKITFSLPTGRQTITGAVSPERPLKYDVPIKLPIELEVPPFTRIETPTGPINARFQKIKEL